MNNENKQSTSGLSLFKQSGFNVSHENNNTTKTNEDSSAEITATDEDTPEESSLTKKLRRSCRPSISARKSLVNNTRQERSIPLSDESISTTSILPSIVIDSASSNIELIKKPQLKGILKRLSPLKVRQDHKRRVVFHDQVKVLVFASPSHRDIIAQQQKKSPNKDGTKSPTRIIPKENLPLRKQPMSARRLSAMNNTEQIIPASPVVYNKVRSSKLFHPNDALADWTENNETCQVNLCQRK
jgi:hypothetical protein